MIDEAPKSEIFVTAKTIPISSREYYCMQGMKLHMEGKHYIPFDKLPETLPNESPSS
jgi:hypothetical protein